MGFLNRNSLFLVPNDQGSAKLRVSLRQPLLQGRGHDYNQSSLRFAQFSRQLGEADYEIESQDHLQRLAQAYWNLYLYRAAIVLQEQHTARARDLTDRLVARRGHDAASSQIAIAQAALLKREADLIRVRTQLTNTQLTFLSLINLPDPQIANRIEVVPLSPMVLIEPEFDRSEEVAPAFRNRSEIQRTLLKAQSNSLSIDVTQNELMPKLDLVLDSYVSGLRGESEIFGAVDDQFRTGAPSYSGGVVFEYPLGKRAARAEHDKRRLARPLLSPRYANLISICGLSAFVWQLLVSFSLLAAACLLLHGWGVVLAALAASVQVKGWRKTWEHCLRTAQQAPGFRLWNAGLRVAVVLGFALFVAFWLPLKPSIKASGFVHYSPHESIRPIVEGMVLKVHVTEGQQVSAGETLIELTNDELELARHQARIDLALSQAKAETARAENDRLALRLAQADVEGANHRLSEIDRQANALKLVAPHEGIVIGRRLQDLTGTWVAIGQELLVIGREEQKELTVLIPQSTRIDPQRWESRSVPFNTMVQGPALAFCSAIDPQVRTSLPHDGLGATVGGPLAVKQNERGESELTEPYFVMTLKVSPSDSVMLFDGQRIEVDLGEPGPTLWQFFGSRWEGFRQRWQAR